MLQQIRRSSMLNHHHLVVQYISIWTETSSNSIGLPQIKTYQGIKRTDPQIQPLDTGTGHNIHIKSKPNKSNRTLLHPLVPNSVYLIQLISQTSSVQKRGIYLLYVIVVLLSDALEMCKWLLRKQWCGMVCSSSDLWWCMCTVSSLVLYLSSSILQPSIKCTGYGTTAREETFVP